MKLCHINRSAPGFFWNNVYCECHHSLLLIWCLVASSADWYKTLRTWTRLRNGTANLSWRLRTPVLRWANWMWVALWYVSIAGDRSLLIAFRLFGVLRGPMPPIISSQLPASVVGGPTIEHVWWVYLCSSSFIVRRYYILTHTRTPIKFRYSHVGSSRAKHQACRLTFQFQLWSGFSFQLWNRSQLNITQNIITIKQCNARRQACPEIAIFAGCATCHLRFLTQWCRF